MKVTIAGVEYARRDYTPKRRGEPAGHGWVRFTGTGSSASGRSEVGLEVAHLVDEVVRLRAEVEALVAEHS